MRPKLKIKLEDSPFVKAFTFAVLKTINPNFVIQEKGQVINTELVPSISERILKPGLMGKHRRDFREIGEPISSKPKVGLKKMQEQVYAMPAPRNIQFQEGEYGKITPLLQDRTISSIECPGPGRNLVIVRAGQRQFTKILLTGGEIKTFLEKVAERALIPLMEGIFRAAVDNFVVSAVVSGMVGSRFMVKKQTPYALLEGRGDGFR